MPMEPYQFMRERTEYCYYLLRKTKKTNKNGICMSSENNCVKRRGMVFLRLSSRFRSCVVSIGTGSAFYASLNCLCFNIYIFSYFVYFSS